MLIVRNGLRIFAVRRTVTNCQYPMLLRSEVEPESEPFWDFDIQFLLNSLDPWRVASLYTVGHAFVVAGDNEIGEDSCFCGIWFVFHSAFYADTRNTGQSPPT